MRDDFNEKTKRVIQERAGNHCSNPNCRVLTSGPNAHPEKSTKTGVAAHITAASPGGPRYNPHLAPEQRLSAENGIWLCQNCAHFIDTDYLNYSVELLCDWKAQAERAADDETKGRKGRLPTSDSTESEYEEKFGWSCPFCGTVVEFDKSVCLGCHAEVVPGLTRNERLEAAQKGMMVGVGIIFLFFIVFPNWLNSSLGWKVGWFWGLGIYGFPITAIIVLVGGATVVYVSEKKRLRDPPRFFRQTLS